MKLLGGFVAALTAIAADARGQDPDTYASFEQICQENGYVSENYSLTTPDDYVISLYRIPGLSILVVSLFCQT